MRLMKDRALAPIAASLRSVPPVALTAIGLVAGLGCAAAAYVGDTPLAVGLWVANRTLDGLDGTVARLAGTSSDRGGYLDLVADFITYAVIPVAQVAGAPDPSPLAVPLGALLGAYYVNSVSWLALSAILERRGAAGRGAGLTPRVGTPAPSEFASLAPEYPHPNPDPPSRARNEPYGGKMKTGEGLLATPHADPGVPPPPRRRPDPEYPLPNESVQIRSTPSPTPPQLRRERGYCLQPNPRRLPLPRSAQRTPAAQGFGGVDGGEGALTTIAMPTGLVEGTETVVFVLACLALPEFLRPLFVGFAVLVLLTALQRATWAWRALGPG